MVGAAAALQPLQSTSSMTLPAGSPLAVLRSYHRHLVTPAVNDGRMDLHVPTSALRRRGARKGNQQRGCERYVTIHTLEQRGALVLIAYCHLHRDELGRQLLSGHSHHEALAPVCQHRQ